MAPPSSGAQEQSGPSPHPWHQAEERFRLLVESVRDYGIFMLDQAGRIVSWNQGAERIKGYRADEILGAHFSVFYPPEEILAGKPERELEEAIAAGRMEDEGWRVRKDGTRFWADVVITALRDPQTGELHGFGKVTRDLTERKMAEESLRQSEEQFRLLVASVEEYAIFLLDPNGRVVTWNSGARRVKGYTEEEIVGNSFERFYMEEDRAAGKPRSLLEHARLHGSARDQGFRLRKDGTRFPADVLITAIHDASGALLGYSKVTRDITDQLKSRDMEAAKLAAEQSSKAKDEFLAVLSHELRTPLTPVVGAVDYLLEDAEALTQPEHIELLQTIRKNVLLEAQLVDDLLDLTRISRGKIELHFEAVNARAAVDDAIAICREDINKKRLRLCTDFPAEDSWVWADPTRLRQIFWNLLNNAVKFTPEGGQVTARIADDSPGHLRFEIIDSGIGIAPEQLDRIFAAFEQAERSVTRRFGGLGLGLAITRSLVQLHHGEIAAISQGKNTGATFRVVLPAIPQPSPPRNPQASARQTAPGLRILLVDDHDDTRRVIVRLLERKGHVVSGADSVAAARALLESHERFDALVSDIGLPDGSGHELMAFAKQRDARLRGIALSGFGMDEDRQRSAEAGFDIHLTKPVDAEHLVQHLRRFATEASSGA